MGIENGMRGMVERILLDWVVREGFSEGMILELGPELHKGESPARF